MVKLILITNGNDEVREAVEQIISEVKPFEFDLASEEKTYVERHKVYEDELDITKDELSNIFDILPEDSRINPETLKFAAYILEDAGDIILHKFEYGVLETPVKFKAVVEIESYINQK